MSRLTENTISKKLLMDAMDEGILSVKTERMAVKIKGGEMILSADHGLITAMIMNRNRVARFLEMPTRDFKKE